MNNYLDKNCVFTTYSFDVIQGHIFTKYVDDWWIHLNMHICILKFNWRHGIIFSFTSNRYRLQLLISRWLLRSPNRRPISKTIWAWKWWLWERTPKRGVRRLLMAWFKFWARSYSTTTLKYVDRYWSVLMSKLRLHNTSLTPAKSENINDNDWH